MSHDQISLYNLSTFKRPIDVRFQSKVPIREGNKNPGPGTYSSIDMTKTKFKSSPCLTIAGAGDRLTEKALDPMPGPGTYAHTSSLSTIKAPFSCEARLHEITRQAGPGPAAYTLPSTYDSRSVSVAGRPSDSRSKSLRGPGPGQYKPDHRWTEKAARSVSFTAGTRRQAPPSQVPGPGTYALQSTFGGNSTVRRSPSYSLTSAVKIEHKSITPGPIAAGTTFK
mmetsp:Transcript_139172/g.242200  ORF Transcript_139172/g.242200 Transcript_139172/m.242200 type:complete len:224 (-) Transcript_139172:50-721(-)